MSISQDLRTGHGKTNREGRKGHEGMRVSKSSCVSPISEN